MGRCRGGSLQVYRARFVGNEGIYSGVGFGDGEDGQLSGVWVEEPPSLGVSNSMLGR